MPTLRKAARNSSFCACSANRLNSLSCIWPCKVAYFSSSCCKRRSSTLDEEDEEEELTSL